MHYCNLFVTLSKFANIKPVNEIVLQVFGLKVDVLLVKW